MKGVGFIFTLIFVLFAISGLFWYWFMPLDNAEFTFNPEVKKDYNFSANGESAQFYENLRYPEKRISYKISGECNLQRKTDIEWAFEIIENLTILDFYPVIANEEISASCEEKIKINERFFIAGEGGPTNITQAGSFSVISHGGILLLKNSECERPNVAIHEILHALGFDHSGNPRNIMYNISKCNQVIGDDTIEFINKLYSFPSSADLIFENSSASMKGRYLDVDIEIRNNGLKDSLSAKIIIFADDKNVNEVELNPLKVGYGSTIKIGNIFVSSVNVKKVRIFINSTFNELDKSNNEIEMEIKN